MTADEPIEPGGKGSLGNVVIGLALIVVGIGAFYWTFFSDDLFPSGTLTAERPGIWLVVRLVAGAALAGGTWLLAVAHLRRQGHEKPGQSARPPFAVRGRPS